MNMNAFSEFVVSSPLSVTFVTQEVVSDIANLGYAVVSEFVPSSMVNELRYELLQRARSNGLRPATVGHGSDNQFRPEIRDDCICWVDHTCVSTPMRNCLHRFEQLRRTLNQTLYLGLFDFECHLSEYQAGARYLRHLDQFKDNDTRRVSCVLYLNEHWDDDDGGELRLYTDTSDAFRDIKPCGGSLVIFLSDRFEHEVLPARRDRYSLAGWFKVRCQESH